VIRVIRGAGLIAAGIDTGHTSGVIIAVIGLVPVAAGTANVLPVAPLFGADLAGRQRPTR
jgi:hypothetical protein